MAKVANFLIKEKGALCKAFFVPEGTRISTQKLQAVCEYWELVGPNTMIACDAGEQLVVQVRPYGHRPRIGGRGVQ